MSSLAGRGSASAWLHMAFLLLFELAFVSDLTANQLPRPAADFTHKEQTAWLNSAPLSLPDLREKVVLIYFWTFDCWNCHRSFIWLNDLEKRLEKRRFEIIGVHTPEFEHEHHRGTLEDKIKLYGLKHPIMIDNDFSYWNALGSRYWPSFFLIDKMGDIRAIYIGQTNPNSIQAEKIEQMIENLLIE